MRMLLGGILCLLVQIGFVSNSLAQNTAPTPEQIEDFRARLNANEKNATLKALFELDEQTAAIEQLTLEMAKLVTNGDEPTMCAAVRCLGQVGDKAEPAIAALVARLNHHDYLVRAELKRVLTGMGEVVVPALKKELTSPSPRGRSAALSVLNNLTTIDVGTLEQMQNDPDSRVRICVAEAWKKHGRLGVEPIADLLKDPETVVAVGAAHALRFHFADTSLSIPPLIESLSRKEVGAVSAMALQSYGTEAQQAIPALIQSIPLGYVESRISFLTNDFAIEALNHIGPPRSEDLDRLRELLDDANPSVRAAAARAIGQLGKEASASMDDLERMYQVSMREHKKMLKQAAAITDEDERDRFLWSSSESQEVAEAACTAIWRIGHDTERFMQSAKDIARQAESVYPVGDDDPFAEFAEADLPLVVELLESPNEHVRSIGTHAFFEISPGVVDVGTLARIRRIENEASTRSYKYVAEKMDVRWGPQIAPWIVEDLHNGRIKLGEFARIASALKIRDRQIIETLTAGLESKDQYLPRQCLSALGAVAESANQAALVLVSNAQRDTELRRTALESLWASPGSSKLVVPFAIECMEDPGYWTRYHAIAVLARVGPDAKSSLPLLKKVLKQASTDNSGGNQIEFIAAIAIAAISGDKSEFQRRFDSAINDLTDEGNLSRYYLIDALEKLGPKADAYFDFVARLLQCEDANRVNERNCLDEAMDLLGVIRSPRAIELLRAYVNDRDWQIRSRAINTLKAIEAETTNEPMISN